MDRIQRSKQTDAAKAIELFGRHFDVELAPAIYNIASHMTHSYIKGPWASYTLSNNGFYMAPDVNDTFFTKSANGWAGDMSADALGITATLTAYNWLAWRGSTLARTYSKQRLLLTGYVAEHPEIKEILEATD